MSSMRAKVRVTGVQKAGDCEQLEFVAVAANSYPQDGLDEDNTYAKYSPDAKFNITVANPALIGKFQLDEKYYVDFTKAE